MIFQSLISIRGATQVHTRSPLIYRRSAWAEVSTALSLLTLHLVVASVAPAAMSAAMSAADIMSGGESANPD